MEFPEDGEQIKKPEFYSNQPELIFDYAREQQDWLRSHFNKDRLPERIDELIEILEVRMVEYFGSSPEISVAASDVHYTELVVPQNSLFMIQALPLKFDEGSALYGKHTLQGKFRGFHVGRNGEMRVYVFTGEDAYDLPAGIYTPFHSVRLEDSQITLTEHVNNQRLEEINEYIFTHLEQLSNKALELVDELKITLRNPDITTTRKLHDASRIVVALERYEMPEHFLDTLIEMTQLNLQLDSPQDITVSAYRELVGKDSSGYIPRIGPASFKKIVPGLGMIGDLDFRSLALLFFEGTNGIAMPIGYITHIEKSIQ